MADDVNNEHQRAMDHQRERMAAWHTLPVTPGDEFFAKHHMTPDEMAALMMHWQNRALKAEATPAVGEPVAWLYTERLPFDPGPGVRVRREPEPLYAAPPASPLRVTGAISLVEEAACLIWSELCPGMVMGDDNIPRYEAAAKAVLALSPAFPLRGRESDLREALEFGMWSWAGPTNAAEEKMLEEQIEAAWQDFKKQKSASPPEQPSPLRGREATLQQALENCRTSYCGYAITDQDQYREMLGKFWQEIKRIDGVARAALAAAATPSRET